MDLIRKRPPLVGHPVSFRIFGKAPGRSENAPGYPREGAFFGSSHSVFVSESRSRRSKPTPLVSRRGTCPRANKVRRFGCCYRHVSFTDPRFSVEASCCVSSAETLVAHQQHHAQLVHCRSARNKCGCHVVNTFLHVMMRPPYDAGFSLLRVLCSLHAPPSRFDCFSECSVNAKRSQSVLCRSSGMLDTRL